MRRIVWILPVFLTFLTVSACLSKKNEENNAVVVGIQSAPATLDPRYAKDANGMRIGSLIFHSLVKIGPDLKVTGDAAKSWEWSKNTIRFQIPSGLTFSNGRPLEKNDILFSFQEYQKPDNPFRSSLDLLDSAEVKSRPDGGFVVVLKMKSYSAKLLTADLPMIRLLPAQEIIKDEPGFKKKPIGTGSFEIASTAVNQITLKARKAHPIATPKIENVTFKVIKNSFTLFQKMKKGEIDIAQSEIPLNKVAELELQPEKFQVFRYPGLSFSYLLINHRDPQLNNLDFRKALAHSIDREKIVRFKLEGFAKPATSLMTPSNPFHDKSLDQWAFLPGKAKQLLNKNPDPIILKTSTNQQAVENGKVLVQQMKQVGFNVELKSYEWGTYFSDIQKGRFQLATMRWVGAVDPDLYRLAFHSNELPPGRNRGAYINKTLDQLLDRGLSIRDPQQRVQHYYKVQKIVHSELAIIPLWYDQQVAVVRRRIKDYRPSMNGDFSPLLQLDILKE